MSQTSVPTLISSGYNVPFLSGRIVLEQAKDASVATLIPLLQYKVNALVALERFKDTLRTLDEWKERISKKDGSPEFESLWQDRLAPVYAYCLYKLNRLQEALDLVPRNGQNLRWKYLEAQVVLMLRAYLTYRMGDFLRAMQVYQELMETVGKDDPAYQDLAANLLAAQTGLVYTSAPKSSPKLARVQTITYEQLFNQACLQTASHQYFVALETLHRAEELCKETLTEDGWSEEDIQEELLAMSVQRAYILQSLGRLEEAKQLYGSLLSSRDLVVRTMANNNMVSASLAGEQEERERKRIGLINILRHQELEKKLIPYQRAIVSDNLALMSYKKGKKVSSTSSEMQSLIGASLKWKKNGADLQALKQVHREFKSTKTLLVLVQALLVAKDFEGALSLLKQEAPSSPALASLAVWIYRQLDRDNEGLTFLRSLAASQTGFAVLLAQTLALVGKSAEAKQVLDDVLKKEPTHAPALAAMILLVSSTDIGASHEYTAKLEKLLAGLVSTPATGKSNFPADLEQLSSLHADYAPKLGRAAVAEKKKRKRKHKRQQPKNFDPNVQPDPERWIPKRLRASELKKRGKKGKSKMDGGSQGAAVPMDVDQPPSSMKPTAASGTGGSSGAAAQQQKKKKKKNKW